MKGTNFQLSDQGLRKKYMYYNGRSSNQGVMEMSKIWTVMKFVGRVIKVGAIVSVGLWILSFGLQMMLGGISLLTGSKKK